MVGESPKALRVARCSKRYPRHAEKHGLQYAPDDGRGEDLFKVFGLAFEVLGLDTWSLKFLYERSWHIFRQPKPRMYWWTPDDSFLDIAPEPFILPPQNKFAYSQGDVTTSSERIEVTKVISSDLEFMAPDFVKLLKNNQPHRRTETMELVNF